MATEFKRGWKDLAAYKSLSRGSVVVAIWTCKRPNSEWNRIEFETFFLIQLLISFEHVRSTWVLASSFKKCNFSFDFSLPH